MEPLGTERTADNIVDDAPEEPTREQLLALAGAMCRDVVKLNEFLNETALRHEWCGSYESRLAKYNDSFEVIRLEDRNSADIERWKQLRGAAYSNYRDPYGLTEDMKERAERNAEVRAAYEQVRLIHDLSMKKPLPKPTHQQPTTVAPGTPFTFQHNAITYHFPDGNVATFQLGGNHAGSLPVPEEVALPVPVDLDAVEPAPMRLFVGPGIRR